MDQDIRDICIQEIALEGLEGVTISALWVRLENRVPKLSYKLSDKIKEFLWKFILQHRSLDIVQLPKPRDDPQIFDRFADSDKQSIPLSSIPDEIDKFVEIYSTDPLSTVPGIRGACSCYDERVNIKSEITAKGNCNLSKCVKKYGAKRLAVVASQSLREKELIVGNLSTPILNELNELGYCTLEKIGRARWQGELQSNLNKLTFGKKSYHIHYIVNLLYKLGLVAKIHHTYRRVDKNTRSLSQVVVTLKKFERKCGTYSSRSAMRMIEELKNAPDFIMNLGKLREKLEMSTKLFRSSCSALVKSGDIEVKNITDKRVRTLYDKEVILLKKHSAEQNEEEDDEEVDVQTILNKAILSVKPLALERPYLHQAYDFIVQNGAKGVSQRHMRYFLKGFGGLEARNICKIFHKMKLVVILLVDEGKQRKQMYISKEASTSSANRLEFSDEKKKMQDLVVETAKLQPIMASADTSAKKDNCVGDRYERDNKTQKGGDIDGNECSVQKKSQLSETLHNILSNDLSTCSTQHQKKWDANLTTRKLKRHNIILEYLNQEKIVEGFGIIQKILSTLEDKEGMTTKIDRRTVIRLIEKMNQDGIIRKVVLPLTHNETTQNFIFVMAIDCSESLLKSAVDRAKFKLVCDEEKRITRLQQKITAEESKEIVRVRKAMKSNGRCQSPPPPVPDDKRLGKLLLPKFKRLRAVHEYLWYLSYGHPESVASSESNDLEAVKIFDTKLTWKRYLPPAPIITQNGLPWLQVGDIAIILPLSVFCKFHNITKRPPELISWLADEDKKHTLVRHLPPHLKTILLKRRRYVFSLTSAIEHLAFMGLVTTTRGRVGNTHNLPRENIMVYVHKLATILDTRTSSSGYVHVEDKEYDKVYFVFDDAQHVEDYWGKLEIICLQTRLGCTKLQEPGHDPFSGYDGDEDLRKYVNAVVDSNPFPNDSGGIPGNQRGAGGLDSSMYSFLCRNWRAKISMHEAFSSQDGSFSFSRAHKRLEKLNPSKSNCDLQSGQKKPNSSETESSLLTSDKATKTDEVIKSSRKRPGTPLGSNSKKNKKSDVSFTKISSEKSSNNNGQVILESNIGRNDRVKGGRGVKRKASKEVDSSELSLDSESAQKKQPRKVQPANVAQQRKQRTKYIDQDDLAAIKKRKGRKRANFTKAEDTLYLLCNVTKSLLLYLYWKRPIPPRTQIIPWSVVRDISQKILPESFDKTSSSVARRTSVLMNNPESRICHDISVAAIRNDEKFLKKFCPADFDLTSDLDSLCTLYCDLVDQLRLRFKVQPGLFTDEIPDSNEQLLLLYSPKTILKKSSDIQCKRNYFEDDVNTCTAIQKSVAENMIYIALTMDEKEFSIFQAHRAFELFPEHVLSDVFSKLRLNQMVCSRKKSFRKSPITIRAYRLAHPHSLTLRSTIPSSLLAELGLGLKAQGEMKIDTNASTESIFLISHFMMAAGLETMIEIPEQVVVPETQNSSIFVNQFQTALEFAKQDLMMEANQMQDTSGSNPPDSVMAALERILKECTDNEGDGEASETKVKIDEIMRLYRKHPSYLNWLTLMKPTKRSESKFSTASPFSTSDCIVVKPCVITLHNVNSSINKYCIGGIHSTIQSMNDRLSAELVEFPSGMENYDKKIDSFVSKTIFDIINSHSFSGISEIELSQSVSFDESTVKSYLKKLMRDKAVFTVGIKQVRYVSYKFIDPWAAKSFKFKDSKEDFAKEIMYELDLFRNANENDKKKKEEEKENKDQCSSKENVVIEKPKDQSTSMHSANDCLKTRYKEVQFICRPWHNLCGGVSFTCAKVLLNSVFMKIYSSPGITKELICASYGYQRICIIEILNILKEVGCIKELILERSGIKSLFGMKMPTRKIVYYESTQNGLIILSQWTDNATKLIEDTLSCVSNK